jgi:DNA invertase Pin-like site-specific DNA recombinase
MHELDNNTLTNPTEKIPAAQYLRMSTEHQQYSPDNQAATIQQYADDKGYNIVSTYSDEGRSGVTTGGRSGLLQLIDDVESGRCGFAAILVYDVSRWGRFQNPDEAAVYEVRCRWAGVPVHYCAEPFENDGSVISSLMKTLKRAMAAEYSRELSAKVTEGHLRMLARGYHQGGFPCFGLQRVLIDADGQRKQILRFGERKNLQSDRVILEPGPQAHIDIVNEVYRRYLDGEQQTSLVAALNERGDFQTSGRRWTEGAMRRMLTSECYIGNIVWGKQDGKLGRSRRAVAQSNWIRQEAAFPNVVELSLFQQVQAEIAKRKRHYSTEEMLVGLRMLLKKHGTLNKAMIDKAKGVASAPAIARRFGSLKAAYEKIGFQAVQNNKYTKIDKRISVLAGRIGKNFAKQIDGATLQHTGSVCRLDRGRACVIVLLARYIDRMDGSPQWYIRWDHLKPTTIAVIGLLDPRNAKVSAYYVVNDPDLADLRLRKSRDDGRCLHPFAQTDLAGCITQVAVHMATMR